MGPEGVIILISMSVFAAAIGLVFLVALTQARRTVANLAAVAARLGLRLHERRILGFVTGAGLEGTVQGRAVRFWSYTTGSGKSQKTWAAAGVRPRQDGGLTFRLSRQGLGTKLQELLGAKEITVGDRLFDAAWFVQTNRPADLAAALLPEIREKLMAAHRSGHRTGGFRLEQGEVVYAEQGGLHDAGRVARLEALLPVLMDLADVAEVSAEAR
jgi:hypothetical protein